MTNRHLFRKYRAFDFQMSQQQKAKEAVLALPQDKLGRMLRSLWLKSYLAWR